MYKVLLQKSNKMIEQLNTLTEELAKKGTFTSMITLFAIYCLLKIYSLAYGRK